MRCGPPFIGYPRRYNPGMLRAVELKLYLTVAQQATLESWLSSCCWLYNQCLEQRIKAYQRRGESVTYNQQTAFLTGLRQRIPALAEVPVEFARDALRRVDRGFQAFFRRRAAGQKPGFPRFRSQQRYNSLEYLHGGSYVCPGNRLRIPNLGLVKCRAGEQSLAGKQKILRIVRRASGWYAQLVLDDGQAAPEKVPVASAAGVDVGLESFATLSDGTKIDNPRCLRNAERKLRRAQRRLSRCRKGSRNRRKAARRVACIHERTTAQRKDFAHQLSRRLVNRFDLLAFEALNVKGLAASRLAKSVQDAAWAMFLILRDVQGSMGRSSCGRGGPRRHVAGMSGLWPRRSASAFRARPPLPVRAGPRPGPRRRTGDPCPRP
jgi:putative transposase